MIEIQKDTAMQIANSEKKAKILINVDCYERYLFYRRISNAYTYYVTHRFGLYLYLKHIKNENIKFIPISKPWKFFPKSEYKIQRHDKKIKSREIELRQVTLEELYAASDVLYEIIEKIKPEWIFAFNDQIALGAALKLLAQEHQIPIRFHEISNFPGYLQSNEMGVNTRAEFKQSEKLQNADRIIELKLHNKQSNKSIDLPFNPFKPIDAIYLRRPKLNNIVNKNRARVISKRIIEETGPKDKILFIEQVVDDTNIVCNSDINIPTLVEIANLVSQERSVTWRPHPKQKKKIQYMGEIDQEVLTDSLFKATLVVTINSTLEIEARLLNRKVITLENTPFQILSMNNKTPKEVVEVYLGNCVRVDYFSSNKIKYEDLV